MSEVQPALRWLAWVGHGVFLPGLASCGSSFPTRKADGIELRSTLPRTEAEPAHRSAAAHEPRAVS